jgi:hypothetical protein
VHLTDGQLAIRAHDQGSLSRDAAAHLASCEVCRARLDEIRRADRETAALLRVLDHDVPAVRVEAVIAAARRRRTWSRVGAIAAGTALFAAVAAAAIPGSPLHEAIARAFTQSRHQASSPSSSPSPSDTSPPGAGTGIALLPGPDLDVSFHGWQRGGQLRIAFVDSPQLSLVPHGGDAAFSVRRGQVAVDNRGSQASFTLEVPRSVQLVRVRVDTTVIFRKSAAGVRARALPDSAGGYTLDLAAPR